MKFTYHSLLLAILGVVGGCGDPPATTPGETKSQQNSSSVNNSAEIENLKHRIAALEKENAELRLTAPLLLAEVRKLLSAENSGGAIEKKDLMVLRFPRTPELMQAEKEIANYFAQKKAAEAEAERRRLLGFKALGTKNLVDADEVKVVVESTSVTGKWIFDDHGHEYSYRQPSRGNKFVVMKLTVTTKGSSDPKLPQFAIYAQEGDTLTRITDGAYQFVRWSDYGSYLGNYADYKNDFDHTAKIPFSYGIEIDESELKKPLFLLASRDGCYSRSTERFSHPPVSYSGWKCKDLGATLKLSDFDTGKFVVVKTLGKGS